MVTDVIRSWNCGNSNPKTGGSRMPAEPSNESVCSGSFYVRTLRRRKAGLHFDFFSFSRLQSCGGCSKPDRHVRPRLL